MTILVEKMTLLHVLHGHIQRQTSVWNLTYKSYIISMQSDTVTAHSSKAVAPKLGYGYTFEVCKAFSTAYMKS